MSRHALSLLICGAITAACYAEETTPAPPRKASPVLQHHEIRADQLPPPFHTPSAGNPPRVVERPANARLFVPPGFTIGIWAEKLDDPRNMVVAPNGDIFVAETAAGRISILRDTDRDGKADRRSVFVSGQNEPFGMAFHRNYLYVGNTDAVVRFRYPAAGEGERLASLPPGGHSTRNVIFNGDGSKMYVAVGSRSNVSDESDQPTRAAITEMNPDGSGRRIFASGLRNPVGLAWNPADGTLWTSVNERDGLGDDLVPDYITEVRPGGFYGWPFSYIGKNVDPRRKGERPDLVARAIVPSVLIQAHSAALGLVFYSGKMFPEKYRGGAFVALHGSWNRANRTGYNVIHVPFRNGKPAGGYDEFAVGWAPDPASKTVWGRPVGLLVLPDGSLLVSDDGAGVIWRIAYQGKP